VSLATLLIDKISDSLKLGTTVVTVPCGKRIIKPWISPGILRCIRNRNKLQKDLRRDPYNEFLRITYRRYMNYCNNLIKRIKRRYDRDNIIKSLNNNKLLWENIKSITYTNRGHNSNTELLNLQSTPSKSADYINNYFASIGKRLALSIQQNITNISSSTVTNIPTLPYSFVLLPTDLDEVKRTILNLKLNSGAGWETISLTNS
jgi:hypothetical protein